MDVALWSAGLFLLFSALLCFYRAFSGPTVVDRLLAVNIVGTKVLVVLVLLAFIFDRGLFIDVAFVYALLNIVVTLAAARYLETGKLREEW